MGVGLGVGWGVGLGVGGGKVAVGATVGMATLVTGLLPPKGLGDWLAQGVGEG